MKVLWITNVVLPEAKAKLGEKTDPMGSWLFKLSNEISKKEDIQLVIASPHKGMSSNVIIRGEKIEYYVFGWQNKESFKVKYSILYDLIFATKPDVVHIFGTEQEHSYICSEVCKENGIPCILQIQGLTSVIYKHYFSGLNCKQINMVTLRDFLKNDNIKQQAKKFELKGIFEKKTIRNVKYLLGRTTWDKACTSQINANARYFSCNEILRDSFYNNKWKLENCERNTIYVSQGYYPIKGLHFLLDALQIVKKTFPDIKVKVSGENPVKGNGLVDRLKISSYGKQLMNKIKGLGNDTVIFTGLADEGEMCENFLNAHIFVSPSTIENESNSLSEAKILGVPSIASYVGGVTDRIKHGIDGFFYQHDAPYMLAHYIIQLLKDDSLAQAISNNALMNASELLNVDSNTVTLVEVYETVICLESKL